MVMSSDVEKLSAAARVLVGQCESKDTWWGEYAETDDDDGRVKSIIFVVSGKDECSHFLPSFVSLRREWREGNREPT
jgi:hypothetical protein